MNARRKIVAEPTHGKLVEKLEEMTKKHDQKFKTIFGFLKKYSRRRGIKIGL